MTRKYNEYLQVDSDFIPVFSRHSDKDFPNKWKSFYPHDSFKSILNQLIDTLEMGSIEKNKPIWMSGAYGTGKTYASFVIKHILEDDIETIRPYFESNGMIQLFNRINGIRSKGRKILVVERSSSGSIIGDNILFNAITQSIKQALKEHGFTYMGSNSQYDAVLQILKDPLSSFNFSKAFEKHKAKFDAYASHISVIKALEDDTLEEDERLELLQIIIDAAEKEGFVWTASVNDVIKWLDDVRKQNDLHSIVFIWDEFTEFFKNNQTNLTGLQEIAMASASIKFYFFLITHSNSLQIVNDLNSRKVIGMRFKEPQIEMADATAFKLMGQAIKINPELKNDWEKEKEDLWSRVQKSAISTIIKNSEDINSEELNDLLPFHPYAAYLLKIISKDISSNQRTMFKFLSGDYEEGGVVKTNFRWFIDNFENDLHSWSYLTPDFIWDYFFTNDNMDLDAIFRSVISHYNNYEIICDESENKKRVLKVTLLLLAMQQKSGANRSRGMSGLLRPTLTNIAACFYGTPIQSEVANILANFVSKNIFSKIEENNDTLFIQPIGNIDEERFNKLKEENRKNISFEKILSDTNYAVSERFLPNDFLKYRLVINSITPNDYKSALDRVITEKPNIISVLFLFSRNETDQSKVKMTIDKIYEGSNRATVVVDFSSLPMTDAVYEKFLHSKTEELYFNQPNQRQQSELAKKNARDIIAEWKNKFDMTSIDIYTQPTQGQKISGGANLRKKLAEINSIVFPHGLEDISKNDKLFANTGYTLIVAQMAMGKALITGNYAYLNTIPSKLQSENIWDNPNFETVYPLHTVSMMKSAIEKVIREGFEKSSQVEVTDIWKELQKAPFGLLPSTGSVFLLGFLLKDYADTTYYKKDQNENTIGLNSTDLADLIVAVIKELPKANNQFIVKQKPEHIEFCQITGDIFKIVKDKQNSIDDISKYIKLFLSQNEYPLWCLKNYIIEELADTDIKIAALSALELLCEFVSPDLKPGRDKTKVAEDIYKVYKTNAGLDEILNNVIKIENFKAGMSYYIGMYKPELITVTRRLGILTNDYLSALTKKLSADSSYLWEIGDTNLQIDSLFEDYQLIDTVNKILKEKRNTIEDVTKAILDKLNIIKLPNGLISKIRGDLDPIMEALFNVRNNLLSNKGFLINIIEAKSFDFNEFFDNQYSTFAISLRNELPGSLVEDEIEYLYKNVESGTLFISTDAFLISINDKLAKYKKNKKINQLYSLWENVTGTENPNVWSNKHQTPILCLFEEDILVAQKVFDLINKSRLAQNEREIDDAISFVEGEKLRIIEDALRREDIFKEYFCGEYSLIVDDLTDFRNYIVQQIGSDVYSWTAKKTDGLIKRYAERKYEETYKNKVREKIKKLSAADAQRLLEELIEDKPLVGINILKTK